MCSNIVKMTGILVDAHSPSPLKKGDKNFAILAVLSYNWAGGQRMIERVEFFRLWMSGELRCKIGFPQGGERIEVTGGLVQHRYKGKDGYLHEVYYINVRTAVFDKRYRSPLKTKRCIRKYKAYCTGDGATPYTKVPPIDCVDDERRVQLLGTVAQVIKEEDDTGFILEIDEGEAVSFLTVKVEGSHKKELAAQLKVGKMVKVGARLKNLLWKAEDGKLKGKLIAIATVIYWGGEKEGGAPLWDKVKALLPPEAKQVHWEDSDATKEGFTIDEDGIDRSIMRCTDAQNDELREQEKEASEVWAQDMMLGIDQLDDTGLHLVQERLRRSGQS